ncbi:MAG: serine/threonine protein kinase [Verrucomicrobia bacterium]|nr:MAG: serine/threonine protein kinase [Verrucomicrobiota bacterium]
MSSGSTCRECGTAIPADSPGGFCAQCLLGLGLKEAEEHPESPSKPAAQDPKLPAESESLRGAASDFPSLSEKSGDRIGRYRLLQEIGHGGCGVVYMAEQEEPVRRKVALKVIKLGMDTRQVVARFEAERQALALMDHPNIARVLDVGATDAGRPYFVMELVGGTKITDYCDQNQLTTRQRLDLFIQVCRAIQHAHQKGIIHRDIKPSNVLVATHDGMPVPKVIDFGIAKATQGRLTDHTIFTAFEQFIGTPAYMSPEQAQIGGLDIDTRSDIYSLGVLLYELLTGKTPFETKELVAAGLDEIRRVIRVVEPVKPSTRRTQELTATDKVGRATPCAPPQHTVPPKSGAHGVPRPTAIPSTLNSQRLKELIHLLRGDLDWIVMKCLEKDRARRYETANGLARDIERHLSNEPVVASPPGNLYRFQKLVRRNRVLVSASASVVAVLLVGVVVSTWQAFRATRAEREQIHLRQQTQTEAVRSQQVAKFLEEMLRGVGPSVARGRDTKMLQEILDRTAERVATDLKDQPLVAAQMQQTIGDVYGRLAEFAKGEPLHRQALELWRKSLGNECPEVAKSLLCVAGAVCRQNRTLEAESLNREALALCRRLFPTGHSYLADALTDLSYVLERRVSDTGPVPIGSARRAEVLGWLDEADVLLQEGLAIRRKLPGDQRADIAGQISRLGSIREKQDKTAEAEKLLMESVATFREVDAPEGLAWTLQALGYLFLKEGKSARAEEAMKESLTIQRSLYPENPGVLRNGLLALAGVLTREGKLAEAESAARSAIAIQSTRPSFERGWANWIGNVLERMGKLDEAEQWYRQAVLEESNLETSPNEHVDVVFNLVRTLVVQNKDSYGEWLENLRKRLPADDPRLARLVAILLDREKFIEGEPLAREILAIREKKFPDDWLTFNAQSALGGCLLGQKKYGEAEPLLLSGYEGMKQREDKIPAAGKTRLKETIQRLVSLYQATERSEQVAQWKTELTRWFRLEVARYREAAEGGDVLVLNNGAWLLATCEDPAVRDGTAAVAYADKAVAATNRKDPMFLDTLAAAHAEAGQFAKAISVQKEAIALQPDTSLTKEREARLKLYEANTPYRERQTKRDWSSSLFSVESY